MSTTLRTRIEQSVREAEFQHEPWKHFTIENFFPDSVYVDILSNLPQRQLMQPLSRKTTKRFVYWLEKKGERPPVTTFWDWLRAELFDYLWMNLEDKFGVYGEKIGGAVNYDVPGYSIVPHTDTSDKLFTGLVYLPDTDEDAAQGTVLMKCEEPDPAGKGHKFDDSKYRPVKTIPYVPNTALFFERTDLSYHAVRPTPVSRWTLSFDVFRD